MKRALPQAVVDGLKIPEREVAAEIAKQENYWVNIQLNRRTTSQHCSVSVILHANSVS